MKVYWIRIAPLKPQLTNYKAFLTRKVEKLAEEKRKEFNFLFRMKTTNLYIFISKLNYIKMLRHETITRNINKTMCSIFKNLSN